MFKWFILGGVLLTLAIQNRLLKRELEVIERHRQQLISKEWDTKTSEHLNLLAELVEHFDGRPNQWPVLGRISSPFGFRVDPFTGYQAMHEGLDIVAPHGTPVHAPAPGRIIFVGNGGLLGNLVIIQHQHNLSTHYAHLSDYDVHLGEWVTRGQKIAQVGSTGRSTGAHLHYRIEKNGECQDPREYLE